jgi:hypothetical protein
MAESIESLGQIIKDYARRNRKFNDRLNDVELKFLKMIKRKPILLKVAKKILLITLIAQSIRVRKWLLIRLKINRQIHQ